ncbi:MAG: Lrp/AsnC ligand binding domain-containing protein [Nitrososphaeria archaeon]|nr:Lrp/AsnC ligand binding domain-containing protein [Nitrososphaeria archaeon]
MVEACILIRTERGKFLEIVQNIKQLKGVKDAYPVLGRFDVVVHASVSNEKELGNVVMKIGNLSGVVFTETLVEVEV